MKSLLNKLPSVPRPSVQRLSTVISFALTYYVLPSFILLANGIAIGITLPGLGSVSIALIVLGLTAPLIQSAHHVFRRAPYKVWSLIITMLSYMLMMGLIPVVFYLMAGLSGDSIVIEINYDVASRFIMNAAAIGPVFGLVYEVIRGSMSRENNTPSAMWNARIKLENLVERGLLWRPRRTMLSVVDNTEMRATAT